MKKQMQMLLDDSLNFYRERQLKKALNTAQIAIGFGENSTSDDDGLAIAYILLAKIYNTNGKYQNEPDFFERAAFCLDKARGYAQVANSPDLQVEIAIVEGRIFINQEAFGKAQDSFEKAVAIAKSNGLQGKLVYAHAGLGMLALAKNDASQCLHAAMQIEQLVESSNGHTPPQLKAEMFFLFSQAYILMQDYSASLRNSQELLYLSRQLGDAEKEAIALRNIAVVSGVKSNYKIGMQYFLEALDKCEQIGYREMVVQVQINIATLYAHLYNYEEAIRRYENVLNEHSDILDEKTKTVVFNNIGNIYLTSERPEIALDYFGRAYSLSQQHDFSDMKAYALAQLSRTKIVLNQIEAATDDAALAQQVFEEGNLINGKQINLLNLAQLAFQAGQADTAHDFALKAVALAQQVRDDSAEIKAYKLLSAIFKHNGNFELALEYQERFTQIQEEFARLQRSRFNLDMEIRHAIREKQKEIELLTKENEFQSKLIQKSEQIARQNEELLRVNDDLRQFAYIASHDLKEPLRMIGSFTQVIEKLAKPHLGENDLEYFNYVRDGVVRMNNLLDGLLRYSTVNKSNEELVDVSLNDMFQLSIANLKIRIIETNAVVERGELPMVKGTQQLFLQLFQNLIANAIKFVQPGTQPYVKVFSEETSAEHLIHIQDNGIGISPENQAKIFDIFKRLHHQSEYPGTGIGLAICQKIATRLGGRISVKSELGEGATFSLYLPKIKEEIAQVQLV